MSVRQRLQGIIATTFVVCALGFGAAALWSRRADFIAALDALSTLGVVTSAALSLAGVFLSAQVWMGSIRAVGGSFEPATARQIFFATQIGKYLPGMAWPYLAQLRFAGRFAIPRTTMVAGQALFLVVHVATGAALACLALPWLVSTDRVPGGYLLVLPPAAALALAVHPSVLPWVVNDVLLRRRQEKVCVDTVGILGAIGWMSAVWLLYGASLAALVVPLAADPYQAWLLCLGGFAFAWVIGFLVIVAPAGAGAREIVLVGVLSAAIGPVHAAAVAVVSRMIMTLVDLGLGAAAAGPARRAVESASSQQEKARSDVS